MDARNKAIKELRRKLRDAFMRSPVSGDYDVALSSYEIAILYNLVCKDDGNYHNWLIKKTKENLQ